MNGIIDIELQDTPQIAAEIDFRGEVIRADDEALKKEYDKGKNEGYNSGKLDGYNDGWGIGYNDGYDTGLFIGNEQGYKKGYDKGHSEGYAEGYEPAYRITALSNLYSSAVFPENAELSLRVARLDSSDAQYVLRFTKNLKKMSLAVESSNTGLLNMQGFVRENTDIEVIDFSNLGVKINNASYFALGATKLKSIYGALDFSECTAATIWLNGANALEDIEFVPETIKISLDFYWCAYLSEKTVQSIIDGLADLTGSAAQNVSFHSSIIDKLTPAQFDQIAAKNWTYS